MNLTSRWRLARDFAAVHWGLLVLVQVADYLAYLLPTEGSIAAGAKFLLTLPLLQAENLLAAAVVGLLAYLAAARLWTRLAYFLVYAVLTGYVVLNQVYYKFLFDNYRLSASEGVRTLDPRLGLDSLSRELDASFAVLAVAAALALLWLAWRDILPARWTGEIPDGELAARGPSSARRARGLTWTAGAAVGLAAVGLPAAFSSRHHNLQHHPLTALAQEAWQRPAADFAGQAPLENLAEGPGEVDPRLAAAAETIRQSGGRPNVVLVVLESVGSRQLLGIDGRLSPESTPHLARLGRQAVLFDGFCSVFPGTVRTHVALNTGGRYLTWGSVYEMLPHEYQGPMLARTFREYGYRTGLFSSARLDGEAMDSFMASAGYETLYDFARDAAGQVRDRQIHSWGAVEEYTLGKIERWLDAGAGDGRPFLLTYLTVATHHPYGVPPGYPAPHRGSDNLSLYRNALHYTDAALGQLFAALARRGLDRNTVIAVTGDHGEAFAEWHAQNRTHKFHLYEENVRSFLLLAHPALAGGPVQSKRVGTAGDLFPTLAALAGLGPVDAPGKDLLAQSFPPRPVFFHKSAYPEKWGLRDGRWKFIQGLRDREAELFDLDHDPIERYDLAAAEPERVRRYEEMCRAWFGRENDEFAARLKGYRYVGGRPLREDDWRAAGPKLLAVGYRVSEDDQRFAEQTVVAPNRPPLAWTRVVSDTLDVRVSYRWQAPSGKQYTVEQVIPPDWTVAWMPYPGPAPMEEGTWTVTLLRGVRAVLTTRFEVAAAAR